MPSTDYSDGLHQLADGVWAWLQPDGGWGLSNAGLIDGGRQSLLVDTQFDLPAPGGCWPRWRRSPPARRSGTR